MTSQPGKQTLYTYCRNTDIQTMKFAHLRWETFFLEESHTKCGEETISRLFSRKPKLSISLDQ